MAKAKPTKHTAAEIAAKAKAANTNMGGGEAGMKDRLGGAAGHSKFLCNHCKTPLTSLTQAKQHHESKHDKLPFAESDYTDVHELHGGVTTQGIAVRGTTNAEKIVGARSRARAAARCARTHAVVQRITACSRALRSHACSRALRSHACAVRSSRALRRARTRALRAAAHLPPRGAPRLYQRHKGNGGAGGE